MPLPPAPTPDELVSYAELDMLPLSPPADCCGGGANDFASGVEGLEPPPKGKDANFRLKKLKLLLLISDEGVSGLRADGDCSISLRANRRFSRSDRP